MGYDFNLTKGDGIILSDVHHALDTDINITVYDVKTVEFAGKERKCIHFKNSYGYYTGYWMEGIGDMNQGPYGLSMIMKAAHIRIYRVMNIHISSITYGKTENISIYRTTTTGHLWTTATVYWPWARLA